MNADGEITRWDRLCGRIYWKLPAWMLTCDVKWVNSIYLYFAAVEWYLEDVAYWKERAQ